jgi:hypothetical protein
LAMIRPLLLGESNHGQPKMCLGPGSSDRQVPGTLWARTSLNCSGRPGLMGVRKSTIGQFLQKREQEKSI